MKLGLKKMHIVLASFSILLLSSTVGYALESKKTRLTLEAATKIALTELPGVILESELDNEDGVLAYDFEIQKTDGSVFEIEINAYTGSVISIEED